MAGYVLEEPTGSTGTGACGAATGGAATAVVMVLRRWSSRSGGREGFGEEKNR